MFGRYAGKKIGGTQRMVLLFGFLCLPWVFLQFSLGFPWVSLGFLGFSLVFLCCPLVSPFRVLFFFWVFLKSSLGSLRVSLKTAVSGAEAPPRLIRPALELGRGETSAGAFRGSKGPAEEAGLTFFFFFHLDIAPVFCLLGPKRILNQGRSFFPGFGLVE